MRRQVAAEIGRGIMKLGDDARTDVGDQAMLDLVQYALCIGGCEPVPVDRQLSQMRHRGERVEGGMAVRTHRRNGYGTVVQVEGTIMESEGRRVGEECEN